MIIVLLANGFEEIEALTPVDMLRRAGCNVKTVGVEGRVPTGSHDIPVLCDATPEDINLDEVTMAIFPGGMPGSLNLDASQYTNEVIKAALKNGAHIAAICAAPLVLGRRGLLNGKKATCFPGFEGELIGAEVIDADFVTDGSITTGKGMEYSLPFAKELVRIAKEMEKRLKKVPSGYLNDAQFLSAVEIAVDEGKISTAILQRKLSIGYGKAAKFIDVMEELGFVGAFSGQKPRQVFLTSEEYEEIKKRADQ